MPDKVVTVIVSRVSARKIVHTIVTGIRESNHMRGLALSGGGFRATLFHLGVISYLYDVESAWQAVSRTPDNDHPQNGTAEIGVGPTPVPQQQQQLPPKAAQALSGIKYITSVSGGSILAAHLVLNWEKYTDFNDQTNFDKAASELVRFTRTDIRGRIVRRLPYSIWVYIASVLWRRSPFINSSMPDWMRRSTADSLERGYDKHLYRGAILRNLAGKKRPQLFLLTTNLGSETSSAAFTSAGLSTSDRTFEQETTRLARAVAASSAFPGMFPAVLYDPLDESEAELRLSDGGIFDNLGVRKFWDLLDEGTDIHDVIVSDASVRFRATFGLEFLEPLTVPVKAADILFRRVYSFEERAAQQKSDATRNCSFTFLKLRQKFDRADADDVVLIPEHQKCLHSTRTDLDEFSDLEVAALVRHGYSVARKVLNYELPTPEGIRPQWNPFIESKNTRAIYKRDAELYKTDAATNDDLDKATKRLKASELRRKRLLSRKDWVSYFTAVILIVPALLYLALVVVYTKSNSGTISNLQVEIVEEKAKNNELGKIAASFVPSNFEGKLALPLGTIDVSAQSATSDAVDFVTRAKATGFRDTFLFKLKAADNSRPEYYAFRPVAVFASWDEADAGKQKAVQEIDPAAGQIFRFEEFCPDAQWNASAGYYDCNNSVEELERRGFVMILQKNLPAATSDFTRAQQMSPGFHNLSEIAALLKSKQGELAAASESQKSDIWKEIFNEILTDYSWGMPVDIKQQFQTAVR